MPGFYQRVLEAQYPGISISGYKPFICNNFIIVDRNEHGNDYLWERVARLLWDKDIFDSFHQIERERTGKTDDV